MNSVKKRLCVLEYNKFKQYNIYMVHAQGQDQTVQVCSLNEALAVQISYLWIPEYPITHKPLCNTLSNCLSIYTTTSL